MLLVFFRPLRVSGAVLALFLFYVFLSAVGVCVCARGLLRFVGFSCSWLPALVHDSKCILLYIVSIEPFTRTSVDLLADDVRPLMLIHR